MMCNCGCASRDGVYHGGDARESVEATSGGRYLNEVLRDSGDWLGLRQAVQIANGGGDVQRRQHGMGGIRAEATCGGSDWCTTSEGGGVR